MAATKIWANILDILWPAGSLYYCVDGDASDPGSVLGGMWVQQPGKTFTVNGTTTYVCYVRVA